MRARRVVNDPETRPEEILRTATVLFYERGYHHATLDDLAARIGFTKPAIYHYFSSKQEILFTIRRRIVSRAIDDLRALLGGPGTPDDKLRAALEAHVRTVLRNIEAWAVFHEERGLLSAENEEAIRDLEREYERLLRDLYADGMARDLLSEADPRLAIDTMLGACNYVYRWYRGEPMEAFVRQVVAMLASGYLRQEVAADPSSSRQPGKS